MKIIKTPSFLSNIAARLKKSNPKDETNYLPSSETNSAQLY